MPQDEIGERLVEAAQAGKIVVRLKGGDPFVFGRGGEEAEALRAAGVAFEVVPGRHAGVAAPAYAGIPVTHRDDASRGRLRHRPRASREGRDGARLAGARRLPGTLVFYMGVTRLARSRRADRRGRVPSSRRRRSSAGTLAGPADRDGRRSPRSPRTSPRGIRAPALTVIGAVAGAAREELAWLEAGRCTGAPSSSPARAPRPAAWRRRCGASARRWSSCPRSGSNR